MVHVGAVDAPVTRADVNAIAAKVWRAAGKGPNAPEKPAVDILGWEFALELNETAKEIAAQARVAAAFKKIPREVLEKKAVEQGDVHFFELGALKVDSKIKKRELILTLSDFVIPVGETRIRRAKGVRSSRESNRHPGQRHHKIANSRNQVTPT
jgi:adenine-specific DNA-methyltransferase